MNKNSYEKKNNYKAKGTEVAFAKARNISKVICYHCGKNPEKEIKTPKSILNCVTLRSKLSLYLLPIPPGLNRKTCLIINSKSSTNVFNNPKLLTKIHQIKNPSNYIVMLDIFKSLNRARLVRSKFGTILKVLQIFFPSRPSRKGTM